MPDLTLLTDEERESWCDGLHTLTNELLTTIIALRQRVAEMEAALRKIAELSYYRSDDPYTEHQQIAEDALTLPAPPKEAD